MTISKIPLTDANRLSDDAWPADARQQTAMQQPPEPWSEPVERADLIDWRGVLIGIVAVAVFCAIWIAIPA
jgi:hypothetical protein